MNYEIRWARNSRDDFPSFDATVVAVRPRLHDRFFLGAFSSPRKFRLRVNGHKLPIWGLRNEHREGAMRQTDISFGQFFEKMFFIFRKKTCPKQIWILARTVQSLGIESSLWSWEKPYYSSFVIKWIEDTKIQYIGATSFIKNPKETMYPIHPHS